MCQRNPRAQSESSAEVTGASRHFSSLDTVVPTVKLSVVTRVCCTDEMTTWSSHEDFNAPTGTCHLISSSHSRASSLPFTPSHRRPSRLARANRQVGDMTAILFIPFNDENKCQKMDRVKVRARLHHLQTR